MRTRTFLTLSAGLLVVVIILSHGLKEPLIEGGFQSLSVYLDEEQIYKTKDPRFINQIIHKVNRSRRESTDNWSIPEPVGSIVLRGEHNQIKVDLHDGGDVAVNGVWVYTGFAFFE